MNTQDNSFSPLIEQAKENFYANHYRDAIQLIDSASEEITQQWQPDAHDIKAASYYMLQQFEEASQEFSSAILANPKIVDYQINKAAALRSMGDNEVAKQMLEQCKAKVKNPVIAFNLRLIAHSRGQNHEIEELTKQMSAQRQLNEDF